MKYKAVIFDCGDTLAHLNPAKEVLVREFLFAKGIDVTNDELRQVYRTVDYCNKQSAVKLKSPEDKKRFLMHINAEVLKLLGLSKAGASWPMEIYEHFSNKRHWELFPEVTSVLERLKEKGYILAALANWDKGFDVFLERLGLKGFFVEALCSADIGTEKPDPEAFNIILRKLSLAPTEAVYVGNEYESDVVGARGAGMEAVLVDREGRYTLADCPVIKNLGELGVYL